MPDIVTDISINQNWNARKGANNPVTFTFTQSSAAFDITTYTFSVQLRKFGSSANLLNLTEGSGVTNNGAAGTLNVVFTSANLTDLVANDYYWQMTVVHPDTFSYLWFQGTFKLNAETYTGDLTSNVTGVIDINGTTINTAITLGVGGGGGGGEWGSITGTLSSQTDLQTALNAKISKTGVTEITGNVSITDPTQTLDFKVGLGIGDNPATVLFSAHNYAYIGRRALEYLEFNNGNTRLVIGSDATGDIYHRNASGYLTRRGTVSAASTASLTIDSDATYQYSLTALAAALTIEAPSGTPFNSQDLLIRIKDNGTARALTWNGIFQVIGVTLPTTTVINKTMYIACIYNSADTKWDVIGVREQA